MNNWDFTYLFATEEDFDKSLKALDSYIEALASYKGKLHNEKDFVSYTMINRDFAEAAARVYQYASLKSDLNKTSFSASTRLSKCQNVYYRYNEVTSFDEPEILAIGYDKIMSFIDNNEEIKEVKFLIQKVFDQNTHVLSADKEKLLSYYDSLSQSGAELYSALAVADDKGKDVTLENGKSIYVTQGSYRSQIENSESENDRKAIFEAVYSYYDDHKNTFAAIYKTVLDADKAFAKAKNYQSSLEAYLDKNKIPTSCYETLIDVASNNTEAIKKYNELRRQYLGLSKYHTYDRFLNLAHSDKKYSYEDAKEMFFASVERFPQDFIDKAHDALKEGFVDVFEKPAKRTGAYSSGVSNLHPYILLNHDYTLDSCFTVAHEAGHSIHSLYSLEAQPSALQDYTIFVAEIASTFNEHNLLDYILKNANTTKEEKITVLQKAIDSIISTFYRQTLFAEFEKIAHEKNEALEAINQDVLSDIMIDLYEKYYGIDIKNENLKQFVWAYIPHMYYTPYYVYQYATSFAASFKIYKDVNSGDKKAFDRYINLLKAGGSAYPMEEAAAAGVDFTKKETFMAVVERLNVLVDELEKLLTNKLN